MTTREHFFGLDAVRFVAAYLVGLDHFSSFGWAFPTASATGNAAAFPYLSRFGNIGPIGVEIFFLLSGYVILASAKGATALQFAANRFIRVFPALWICALIAVIARAAAGDPFSLLVRSFINSAVLSPIGPYADGVVWTLVVEAVFYTIIFSVLLTRGKISFETVAAFLGLASSLFICVLLCSKMTSRFNPDLSSYAPLLERFPFKVFLLRHGVFFALGMEIWTVFSSRLTTRRLLLIGCFFTFCTIEVGIDHGHIESIAQAVAVWWLGAFSVIASIKYSQAIYRMLHKYTRLLTGMGRFSYPLYLNHYTLGQVIVPCFASWGFSNSEAFYCSVFVVSLSSFIIMRWPERALQKVLRSGLPHPMRKLQVTAAPNEVSGKVRPAPAILTSAQ